MAQPPKQDGTSTQSSENTGCNGMPLNSQGLCPHCNKPRPPRHLIQELLMAQQRANQAVMMMNPGMGDQANPQMQNP